LAERPVALTSSEALARVAPVRRVGFAGRAGGHELSVRQLQIVALASLLFIAAALRLWLLGEKSLWFDEAYSLFVAGMPPRDLVTYVFRSDAHPPGSYLLLRYWIALVGNSEVAARMFGVLPSFGAVALTYLLARRVAGVRVALLATGLMAVAPFQVAVAQQVRMYALLTLLTLASTYLIWRALEQHRPGLWIGYALVQAASIYVHYFAFLIWGFHALYVLLFARRSTQAWRWFLGASVVVALLYAPWWSRLAAHIVEGRGWAWFKPRTGVLDLLSATLSLLTYGGHQSSAAAPTFYSGAPLPPAQAIVRLLPFAILAGVGSLSLPRQPRLFLTLYLLAPLSAVGVATLWRTFAYPRYFPFLQPAVVVLVAAGITKATGIASRALRWVVAGAALAAIVLLTVPVLYQYYVSPEWEPYDWRGAAAFLEEAATGDDVIVLYPWNGQMPFDYYYRGRQPRIPVLIPDPRRSLEQYEAEQKGETFTRTMVPRLWAARRRLWLVSTLPVPPESQERLEEAITTYYRPVELRVFGRLVGVTRYEVRPVPAPRLSGHRS